MKKLFFSLAIALAFVVSVGVAQAAQPAGRGFDEFGYNRAARIFVGPVGGWCANKGWGFDCAGGDGSYLPYANDHLTMKWNSEWDRGNAENWTHGPYEAWLNNEWNGQFPGGSGETWIDKIKWVGPCGSYGTPTASGGYCIWGQFEVVMEQGNFDHVHFWYAHSLPTGYGAN